jgi:integrase
MDKGKPYRYLRFPKVGTKKTKEEVKYLTEDQFAAVLAQCDQFPRMSDYNKARIKALILTMRWTGLRISDAVVLRAESIAAMFSSCAPKKLLPRYRSRCIGH